MICHILIIKYDLHEKSLLCHPVDDLRKCSLNFCAKRITRELQRTRCCTCVLLRSTSLCKNKPIVLPARTD